MRERVAEAIERSERSMLLLAAIAVLIYLADLLDVWEAAGIDTAYHVTAIVIDVVFVIDLGLKCWALGWKYVKGPWFVIDLVSALPMIATVVEGHRILDSLRVMRAFRVLRTLRILRALRGLRVLKKADIPPGPEAEAFEQFLKKAVLVYTIVFLGVMSMTQHDGEFYLVVGSLLGMSLVLVVMQAQIPAISARHVRALLNVALPHQVASHFVASPRAYDATVRMPATISFSDIKGFTTTVENLQGDLDTLKEHLEDAMDTIVDVHVGYDLIVDKFIGDAVMSFRGGDLVTGDPPEHAYRVVRAALDAKRALRDLGDPFFKVIKTGGASSEAALIGTFGTSKRLSYTILGDRVNLAARLEAACNSFGVSNLFCDRTHLLTKDRPDLVWRRIGKMRAKGKSEAIDVYEVHDLGDETSWIAPYEAALERYEARNFEGARALFLEVDAARPEGDGPSKVLVSLCDEALEDGIDDDWQPIAEPPK